MAIVFIDGFDHYTTTDLLKKWSLNFNSTISQTLGRRGGGCLLSPHSCVKNFTSEYTTLIAGGAFYPTELFSLYNGILTSIFGFSYGNQMRICIGATTAGEVVVLNYAQAVLGRTKPGLIQQGVWSYIEFKAVAGQSTGAVEVRVNGKTELTLTNVNTTNGNSFTSFIAGYRSNLVIEPVGNNRLDDIYVLSTTGVANNDFLGDCRVDAYMPTSEGSTQSWTPTPAGTHYTTVDEIPISAADYVESATAGAIELFGYTDLVNIPLNVYGVQLNSVARKTDAGERQINGVARIGGTDYLSTALSVEDVSKYIMAVWDRSPATSAAWTRSEINGTDFGIKLI